MKILLTGPYGNLGKYLTENLEQAKHTVIPLSRNDWTNIDEILKSGIDLILHAAYDLKNKVNLNPSKIVNSNIETTVTLLEKSKKFNVPHFSFLSSCAVYGDCMHTHEDAALSPVSINGMTKLLNEKIVQSFCASNNIGHDIFRIFNIYGGNDHFSVLHHLKNAKEGKSTFKLNNHGISQRDFIHVADVAKIISQLIDIKDRPHIVNIGTGNSVSVKNIFDLAIKKYPETKFEPSSSKEAEYSRADVSLLKKYIDIEFKDILNFVANEW